MRTTSLGAVAAGGHTKQGGSGTASPHGVQSGLWEWWRAGGVRWWREKGRGGGSGRLTPPSSMPETNMVQRSGMQRPPGASHLSRAKRTESSIDS
jgi:hypothetical protein